MSTSEIIEQLKQLKAAIEWDMPLDYQIVIDEAIKVFEASEKEEMRRK